MRPLRISVAKLAISALFYGLLDGVGAVVVAASEILNVFYGIGRVVLVFGCLLVEIACRAFLSSL